MLWFTLDKATLVIVVPDVLVALLIGTIGTSTTSGCNRINLENGKDAVQR
jgi:hypothetical protein